MANRAILGVDTSQSPPVYRELRCDSSGLLLTSGGSGAPAVSQSLSAAAAPVAGTPVQPGAAWSVIASGAVSSGAGSATVVVRGSHDGVVWIVLATLTLALSTAAFADGIGSTVPYRYVRADLTAISGTGAVVNATVAG